MKLDQERFHEFTDAVARAFKERFDIDAWLFIGLVLANGEIALGVEHNRFEPTMDALEAWIQLYRAGRGAATAAPKPGEIN